MANPATSAYKANLYPAVQQQGAAQPLGAICLSGGGSRALSCALGQLSALTVLPDPNQPGKTLLQDFSYISSVSGGSWASVLYTYLPANITDAQFLIRPYQPQYLTQTAMQQMAPQCLGSVPQQFSIENIGDYIYQLYQWGFFGFDNSAMRSWFWIAGIGELVLKPFGLYDATYSTTAPYLLPASPFSASQAYVQNRLIPQNPNLASASFYTPAPNRLPLIVNFNILTQGGIDPPQLPVQAMAIGTGAPGNYPGGLQGGGAVESFGFTPNLAGQASAGVAAVQLNRWYSLCDIAGCSSAFFAEYLLQYVKQGVDDIVGYIATRWNLSPLEKGLLEAALNVFLGSVSGEIIPSYNYWSPATVSQNPPVNQVYGFSDGGDFDNTGILGALAQTGANRIVAFVNSEVPISKQGSAYFLDSSLPLLFGSYYPPGGKPYQSYGGMSPSQPMSYVQVFDNSSGQLDQMCEGLYNASCGGPNQDSKLGTYTAMFTQTLTTVANPVANIAAGREVQIVWMYNFRVDAWQSQIKDAALRTDLANGQAATPSGPLANFPNYDTGLQIDLSAEAVNMLAQLSAWNVQQAQSAIAALFQA